MKRQSTMRIIFGFLTGLLFSMIGGHFNLRRVMKVEVTGPSLVMNALFVTEFFQVGKLWVATNGAIQFILLLLLLD